jgi:hypothetical protein
MATITGKNKITLAFDQAQSYGFGNVLALPTGFSIKALFEQTGVTADKCNLLYAKELTFVASTPQTLNLKSLPDIRDVAAAVVFARVRLLAIRIGAFADGAYLECGAEGSANEWLGILSPAGAKEKIMAGTSANDGFLVRGAPNTTGWPVATDSRLWKLTPSAHAIVAQIIIAGCDA